jgi:hypothetical protein
MEKFKLVDELRDFAADNGWLFYNGDNFYVNIDADAEAQDGQLILWLDVNATPGRAKGNRLNRIEYTGSISLGRKFDDDGTPASLDESFDQKYTRRLSPLLTLLSDAIKEFTCANELQVESENYIYDINRFDTNIDFVVGTFTIVQEVFTEAVDKYILTVAIDGDGVTSPDVGTYQIQENTTQQLIAAPNAGNEFTKWVINSVDYLQPVVNLVVDGAKSATAYFESEPEPPSSISFTTNKNGTFAPFIETSDGSVATWNIEGEAEQVSNSPIYTLDGSDKNGTITIDDFSKVTKFEFFDDGLKGTIDCSLLINCTSYKFNNCSGLTSIINPISDALVTTYTAPSCNLTGTLDMSVFSNLGGSFQVQSNPNLTAISTGTSTQIFSQYYFYSCNITGSIDLSGYSNLGGVISYFGNSNLTSISFPTSSQLITTINGYQCNITGVLDVSGLNISGNFKVDRNPNLTNVLFPTTSNNFATIYIYLTSIGVIDWTKLTGQITSILISNNNFTSAESDETIVLIDTNVNLTTSLNIAGTNGELTDGTTTGFDGLAAKDNLITEGVSVTFN